MPDQIFTSKILAAVAHLQRGTSYIYQGEEIVNVEIDNMVDYSILLSNYQNISLEEGLILNLYQAIILLKKETL